MKTKKLWMHIGIVVVVLMTLVPGGTVVGQEPETPPSESGAITGPAEVEGGAGAEDEISIMASPAKTMNYQGYLTTGGGDPLDGNYNMVFSLWDEEGAGTGNKEWGDETHNAVPVSNGLFTVVLGETVALDPYTDFDEQLYLEITVNGTTLPRQMLRAVPYAMGLTAGAQVRGTTDLADQYGLYIQNAGGRGLYVDADGDNLYGIYNADVTYSRDGYAGPPTYLFVPTLNAIMPYGATGEHLSLQNGNYMMVVADAAGTATVYIPIQIERPYGRDYLLDRVRVYYSVNEASITWAGIMGMDFSGGGQTTIGSSSSTHDSTSFAYFDIYTTSYYTVTHDMAPTSVAFNISMGSDFGYVNLYGVRLRLKSSY